MKIKGQSKNKPSAKTTNTTPIAMVVMVLCLAVIIGTIELSKLASFKFIADHRNTFVSIELTVFVKNDITSTSMIVKMLTIRSARFNFIFIG